MNPMNSLMKVLFLTHNYPRHNRDYSGIFLHLLARQLKDENVEVTVLAPHDAGLPELETLDGIPVRRFRYDSDEKETFAYRGNMHRQLLSPTGLFRFRRFLRAMRQSADELIRDGAFDLIAAHWVIPSAPVGSQVAKEANIPLVVHSHGTDVRLLSEYAVARWFAGDALKRAQSWSVVSSYLQSVARSAFPAHAEKIAVCPLPNDETLFYPDELVGAVHGKIICVTRFTEQKRVSVLIDACRILKDRDVSYQLRIFGVGPLKGKIEEQTRNCGLKREDVELCNPESHSVLRTQYTLAEIVVLNSFKEGFGLTLVEGALCGAMPVGVNSGGITDIIEHGKTGLLAEVDNAESLADVLQEALTNSENTRRMADAARENALERFTGPAVARRYAEIYRRAVE
jgi:L-malate glycosyltransferase